MHMYKQEKGKNVVCNNMLLKGCSCVCRRADPRAVNGEGKTPLELAIESNFVDSNVLTLLSDANG